MFCVLLLFFFRCYNTCGFKRQEEAELCFEDEVGFIKYVSKASDNTISTKE